MPEPGRDSAARAEGRDCILDADERAADVREDEDDEDDADDDDDDDDKEDDKDDEAAEDDDEEDEAEAAPEPSDPAFSAMVLTISCRSLMMRRRYC